VPNGLVTGPLAIAQEANYFDSGAFFADLTRQIAFRTAAGTAEAMQRPRQMVFVSGAPGAGKTSLAVPLAA
jgi:hypothetical protein